EIVAFDADRFGANRRKLLAALWRDHAPRTLVARHGGKLCGYLFARDPVLGPWVADDASIAERLLQSGLGFPFANAPQVMVPRSNLACIRLLAQRGFVERRTLRHMRRGGAGPAGRAAGLFGQSSFAHG